MNKTLFILLFYSVVLYPQWIKKNIYPGQNLQSVYFFDSSKGWICGNNGIILHSTDGGDNWIQQESGVSNSLKRIKFTDLQNGWAVGDSGIILHTTSGGSEWIVQHSDGGSVFRYLSIVGDSNIWVASPGRTMVRSTDAGKSWSYLTLPLPTNSVLTGIYFTTELDGYLSAGQTNPMGGAIFRTSDGGMNWVLKYGSVLFQSSLFFLNENLGWAIGNNSLIKTTNGGQNWQSIGNYQGQWFNGLFFVDQNIGWIIENKYDNRYDKLLFTSDGGITSIPQYYTEINEIVVDLNFVENRFGWIVIGNTVNPEGVILVTNNGGAVFPSYPELVSPPNYSSVGSDSVQFKWHASHPAVSGYSLNISTDSNFVGFLDTLITDTTIFLNFEVNKKYYWRVRAQNNLGWGGYSSVNSFDTYLTDLKEDNELLPQDFELHQNYPNPFNPSTRISWQSPVGSHQVLKVFDVLGREVATLVNDYKETGYHEVEFQSSVGSLQLASGIYYYQLRAGSFIETKKMVMIR